MADKNPSWYIPSVHHSLTTDEVKEISDDLNLHCSPELLEAIRENTSKALRVLDVVDELGGYLPEVKYPRVTGRRPESEENTGNAWAWLCDIKGAPTGKLAGKKIALKDTVAVAGVPMSCGSKVLEGYTPEYDATIVTRILDEGGHIVGKSSCDDFCLSAMGYSSTNRYIHLPQRPDYRIGGSSGGSAVLVATGDVDLAIACDQGGSIRIPSAWCGVVGLKPTHGRVPYTGIASLEATLDHAGPVARTVTDCALFTEVLAGYNGIDPRQKDIPVPEYSKLLEKETNFKLGKLTEGFECCDMDVRDYVAKFLDKISSNDHLSVEDVSTPLHKVALPVFIPLTVIGSTTNTNMGAAPLFVDGFHSTSLQKAIEQGIQNCPRLFSPGIKQFTVFGEVLRRRYGHHYYAKCRNLIIDIRKQVDEALEKCDVLVMPTLTSLPPKMVTNDDGKDEKDKLLKYLDESIYMISNTMAYNMTGHPALTIPLGKTGDPTVPALMIVGRKYDELKVFQVGRAIEKIVQGA